jgi:class III poly(R)-hydroxyalkanoic acid synthase PhaE subunit
MALSEQTETMLKALTEAQKKIWESWFDMLKTTPASPSTVPNILDQWRDAAAQGLQGWTTGDHLIKDVVQRMMAAQDIAVRFLLSAWTMAQPKAEADGTGPAALSGQIERLRQQLLECPQSLARAFHHMGELWTLYVEEWQKLAQPWAESLRRAAWPFHHPIGDGSALLEWTTLYWDAYERTFGRLLESPSMGHTRELSEDLVKGFNAWVDSRRASFEYQVLLAETWTRAVEQFIRTLVALGEKGEPVQNLRQWLDLWIDVVEDAFTTLFRSDEYIRKQSQLVNSVMAYRLIERDLVDAFLKTSHVPSRSELDEAHRRIYELRKEVKELKRTMQEMKGERSSLGTPPDPSPRPMKRSSKPNQEGAP